MAIRFHLIIRFPPTCAAIQWRGLLRQSELLYNAVEMYVETGGGSRLRDPCGFSDHYHTQIRHNAPAPCFLLNMKSDLTGHVSCCVFLRKPTHSRCLHRPQQTLMLWESSNFHICSSQRLVRPVHSTVTTGLCLCLRNIWGAVCISDDMMHHLTPHWLMVTTRPTR